jgi:hypothetical protein
VEELGLQLPESHRFLVDLRDALPKQSLGVTARTVAAIQYVEQLLDLTQAEAESLRTLEEAQSPCNLLAPFLLD